MADSESLADQEYNIGDVVREQIIIVPPEREPWHGIVVNVEKAPPEWESWLDDNQQLITVHWFQTGTIEYLPGCVLQVVQKR